MVSFRKCPTLIVSHCPIIISIAGGGWEGIRLSVMDLLRSYFLCLFLFLSHICHGTLIKSRLLTEFACLLRLLMHSAGPPSHMSSCVPRDKGVLLIKSNKKCKKSLLSDLFPDQLLSAKLTKNVSPCVCVCLCVCVCVCVVCACVCVCVCACAVCVHMVDA